MSRPSRFLFWRDSKNTANAPQPEEDEARANFGIRELPLRADLPPPQLSGINVQHVDIIAVHGLGGNWLKTWRADDGAIWLRDRLPQLFARANIQPRILSFGYDANLIFTNTVNDIEIVAGDLLSHVDSVRTTSEQKKTPLIFIAHSLGGLVVKQSVALSRYNIVHIMLMTSMSMEALNKAWTENTDWQNIVDKAAGCVFLGVPHRGADLAYWAGNAALIMNVLTGRGNKRLVRAISRSSNEWKKVGSDFRFRATNIFIASFFETEQTGGKIEDSANLGLSGEKIRGLPRTNHRNICKFGDNREESDRFLVLGNYITWIAESALGRGQ